MKISIESFFSNDYKIIEEKTYDNEIIYHFIGKKMRLGILRGKLFLKILK